jgi:hypothetical protein
MSSLDMVASGGGTYLTLLGSAPAHYTRFSYSIQLTLKPRRLNQITFSLCFLCHEQAAALQLAYSSGMSRISTNRFGGTQSARNDHDPSPFPDESLSGHVHDVPHARCIVFFGVRDVCNTVDPSIKGFIHRVPALIVESILFGLVAVRAIQLKPWSVPHAHGLVTVVVRDGSWTFLCLLGQFTCAFSITTVKSVV